MSEPARALTRADVDEVAASLALAFDDDPVMAYLFPRDGSRHAQLVRWFRVAIVVQHLEHGLCFSDDGLSGGALWDPPRHWRMTTGQLLRGSGNFIRAFGLRIPLALRALNTVERVHPREPHFYLAVLGTRPDRQGKGLASASLAPVLTRCDREGTPAYLESSKETNIAFYNRHGFEVTGEIRLPGGPLVWPMWREPRPPE